MRREQSPYCRLCYKVIAPFDPDRDESGKYHTSCMKRTERHRIQVMYVMSLFLLVLAGCASAPARHAEKWLQGCTAALSQATGSIFYERVTVVGIKPQGTDYWVVYPDRKQHPHEGKVAAEPLPVEQFIERGKVGHARGRPCRCPQELWGMSSDN